MKHNLKIIVSKKPINGGIVACRQVNVRERLLRFLLGDKQKLTVIVPGDSVEEVAIKEIEAGNDALRHCSPMQPREGAMVR
ncbi:MAG: hypothetical protein ACI4C7_02885 [Clostridia bacterium]